MSSLNIVLAIKAIDKDKQIVVYGSDLDTCTIQWDVGAEISKADIKAKMDAMASEKAIDDARILGYGDISEQLDQLYHDMAADKGDKTGEWFKAIKKVKDDNAKD